MEKNDILEHYMVTKKLNKKINLAGIINYIIVHIQNNEIYFKYKPTFWEGVLIFGIIGTKVEHKKLENKLSKIINKLGGKLEKSLNKKGE